jgi:hypothetical protein
MRFLFTIITCTILCSSSVFAQTKIKTLIPKDSVPFNNRKYKQELGIDIQGLFSYGPGGQLVWKIRDDRGKLIPVSYSNYWRIQAGLNGNTFTGYRDSIITPTLQYVNTNPAHSDNHFWATIGRERNNFSNRFNFFYGWDAGLGSGFNRNNGYVNIYLYNPVTGALSGSQSVPILTKTLSFSAYGSAFIGVKYHITDRISITAESAFVVSYSLVHRKTAVKDTNNQIIGQSPSWYSNYGYNMDYLRFITLNYRFKRYS